MVKSGIVVSVDRASNIGIIEDKHGQEWFFTIHECFDNEMPPMYSVVTFVRDRDYTQTQVAALVKSTREPAFKVG